MVQKSVFCCCDCREANRGLE